MQSPKGSRLRGFYFRLHPLMIGERGSENTSVELVIHYSDEGFMLLECGLGLYALAFVHLIAHSHYKAYAFLSAGETVAQVRRMALYERRSRRYFWHCPLGHYGWVCCI